MNGEKGISRKTAAFMDRRNRFRGSYDRTDVFCLEADLSYYGETNMTVVFGRVRKRFSEPEESGELVASEDPYEFMQAELG